MSSHHRMAAAPHAQAAPEVAPPAKRRNTLGFLALTLATLAGIILLHKREGVLPEQVQKVNLPPAPKVVVANGKVAPVREIKISPEVSGEIIQLPVKEGQQVKKGDLLLKIKPDFYLASRDQAAGNLKSAMAGVHMARASLEQAEAERRRNAELHRSGLVSDSAFEGANTASEIAKAQLTNAEGQLEMARASLAKAQYDLDKTTIYSPITGTIAKLSSEVGERVVGTATMAGTEVMTVADLNEMDACVQVGETDVGLLSCGQEVQLEAHALKGYTVVGKITEIATSSTSFGAPSGGRNRETTAFDVRIRIQQKPTFRPGMSVTAKIQVPTGILDSPTPTASTKAPVAPWNS